MQSLFLTDLDGTLLRSDRTIGARTLDALDLLAERNVVRVVATGRSLHSVRRVLNPEAPVDYLIFSSGAGLVDWGPGRSQELLLAHTMKDNDIERAAGYLLREDMDVMIHRPAPESHCFGWLAAPRSRPEGRSKNEGGEDLRERVKAFADHVWPLDAANESSSTPFTVGWTGPASMVLGVADPENHARAVARARDALPGLQVVRTTSPINGRSLWLEILPPDVSKASAGQWLADHLGIEHARTFAVGNDYNDEALLAWACESAVVAGAPGPLRTRFIEVADNDADGVAEAILRFGI
jgi:hydroxymethylpyrimidine pyrophosphatase-like HAD family hydrolase